MNMRIQSASSSDCSFSSDNICARANNQGWINSVHGVRVASFTNANNDTILDPYVRLVDAAPVNDEGIRDHGIHGFSIGSTACLAHTFSKGLAAAKFTLVPIAGEIAFHFDP